MAILKIFIYVNCHHGYCKYHDISKLVVTVQQTVKLVGFNTYANSIFNSQALQFLRY